MSSGERKRTLAFALLASLAIHLSLTIGLSLATPTRSVSARAWAQSRRNQPELPASDGGKVRSTLTRDLNVAPASQSSARSGQLVPASRSYAGPIARSGEHTAAWLNHLWQSTLFAFAVGLLTMAFRKNDARVRYGMWFATSVKFLIPLSLFIGLGARLPWKPVHATIAAPVISQAIAQIGQPFLETGSPVPVPTSSASAADWTGVALFALWACGCAAIVRVRLAMWRRVRRAVKMSTALELPGSTVPIRMAPGLLEPGVVGLLRPVILLPAGIQTHLTPAQLDAVLTHEVCHVRRRDNLTSAVHMLVEAIFWFHPLVWWIGARLVDERERACDEEVLRTVAEPRTYADGILNVCKRYVNAQLPCVSGVSGSDLRKRIEAIMRHEDRADLNAWRKSLLAAGVIATVAIPLGVGTLSAPVLRAQSQVRPADLPAFEVASVKPNKSGDVRSMLVPQPGGRLTATNVTAVALIRFAYELPDFQLSGGPAWLDSDRFDVLAKAEGDPPLAQKRLMLRRLLDDRFKLVSHTETRELPIYAMVMARRDGRMGPQLRHSSLDCTGADQSADRGIGPSNGREHCGFFGFASGTNLPSGHGGFAFRGLTMEALAKVLVPAVRRKVVDRTGLSGYYDADFDFMAEIPPPPPPPGVPNPFGPDPFVSVFTVFPEQLGLKLDGQRGPVDVLVIDRADRPTEN